MKMDTSCEADAITAVPEV